MADGTRPIFWLDMLLVTIMAMLVALGKWDWALAVLIALAVVNTVKRLQGKDNSLPEAAQKTNHPAQKPK